MTPVALGKCDVCCGALLFLAAVHIKPIEEIGRRFAL
jgi:hypothetical protein